VLIIACSFRSFDGGPNDLIQQKFIDSVRNQKVPIKMVVVQFGEKNIESELIGLDFDLIELSAPWTHTEVLSIAHLRYPEHDLIHSSVDVILPTNFSIEVTNTLKKFDYCTSWPYLTLGVKESKKIQARNSTCLDLIAFANRILPKVTELTRLYPNVEWGLFEHQAVCFAYISSNRKRGANIYRKSPITRQATPHIELGETTLKLKTMWRANLQRWNPWLNGNRSRSVWLSIYWVLLKFRGTTAYLQIWLLIRFSKYAFNYIFRSRPWGFEIRD
jgi:hypothetical protein